MQRNSFFRLLYIFLLVLATARVFGQDQTSQNWWFGNNQNGIQFSQPGDTALLVTRPVAGIATFGTNGSAVASDPSTGGLLFYTDGSSVYDATHRVMPNGTGLGGNPAGGQPAVISRVPGTTNRYYVITNSATTGASGSIFSSVVDMTLIGNNVANPNLPAPPLGDVDATGKAAAVANLTNESQAMVLVKHFNGDDYWLITQVSGTTTFNVTAITATGITAPAAPVTPGPNPANPALVVNSFTAAHFAYDTVNNLLAVAPEESNRNVVIYSFDNNTGTLQIESVVANSAVSASLAEPVIFDIEWSNSRNYLYISRMGDGGTNGELLQYDRITTTASPLPITVPNMVRSYGLQLGLDSSLYHLYSTSAGGPILAGRITNSDTVATAVTYESAIFNGAQFGATQFPSFLVAQPIPIIANFTWSGTCANTPVSFFPTVEPPADSLRWTFDDGTPIFPSWSPNHTYAQGGSYNVTLSAYVNGDSIRVTQTVPITQFDLSISLVQDTIACSCELLYPKNDTDYSDNNADRYPNEPDGTQGAVCPNFSLTATPSDQQATPRWFGPSGELTNITGWDLTPVDSAGFYYVTATQGSCVAYAGVNIQEYGIQDPTMNIWHFGNNAGLDFNLYSPTDAINPIEGPVVSAEGVATISDQNGQVLFSTNGQHVWDRDGTQLTTGTGLGGSPNAAQSAFIVPFPADPTLYYIFVTQEIYPQGTQAYELRYAIFDLKIGKGNVVDPDNNPANGVGAVLFTKSTERITGNQGWVIAHEYGNNNFRAYPITGQGIGAPVISSIGSDHSLQYAEHGQGYMKLSGANLIVALSTPGISNVVEVFDFNNGTGAVTNFQQVDLQQPFGQVYGVELRGNRLFATTKFSTSAPGASMLHEFVLDPNTDLFTRPGNFVPITATGELGAMETGPDGQTYVAVNNSGALGTITVAGDMTTPSTFNESGRPLTPTPQATLNPTSSLGLPNFIQSIATAPQAMSIAFNSACEDLPIDFTGTGTSIIDTLTWDFGDGQRMTGANLTAVQHTYDTPGNYTVTLTVNNRCAGLIGSISRPITISPTPQALSGAVAICTGTEVMVATASPQAGDTFLWSTGDNTLTLVPPDNGTFTVTVTSAAGCADTGSWDVADVRPQIELGPDLTLCENVQGPQYDFNGAGTSYVWTENGAPFSTLPALTLPTTNPGTFTYVLTVDNSFTGCSITDDVTLTINEQPTFTAVVQDVPTCGNEDGSIDLQLTNTSGTFTYVLAGPSAPANSSSADVQSPSAVINITPLFAGTYTAFVTNQVTGCRATRTIGLSNGAFTADIARAQDCPDADGLMPVTITTSAGIPYTYQIFQSGNATPVQSTTANTVAPSPVTPGGYVVEVTSPPGPTGCIEVSPVRSIRPLPEVPFDNFVYDVCDGNPITVEAVASQATTFAWTGPNIVGATNTSTITANPTGTQPFEYFLEISGNAAISCPHDTTLNVYVGDDPTPVISPSSACSDLVTLAATPVGTEYEYVWQRNSDTPFAGASDITIGVADNGATYTVSVRNQNVPTCPPKTSAPITAEVFGLLSVDLVPDPQICEGSPFNLTANASQPGATFTWLLDGEVIPNETGSVLTINGDREGLFEVVAAIPTTGDVCEATDDASVTLGEKAVGLLPDTGIICPESETSPFRTVTLDAGPGFTSYTWTLLPSTALGTEQTQTATATGTYRVDLVSVDNCPGFDEIILVEECDPVIYGPNAFRPSGTNDQFFLFTEFIETSSFEIYIFNRWGEMVYYENDPAFRWNGGYKNDPNQPLPQGTYSYLVKYRGETPAKSHLQEYRGGVVLLR